VQTALDRQQRSGNVGGDGSEELFGVQIKPAQKLGLQWCCSMCRKPEVKVGVAAAAPVSDVSLFVEELNLPQEAEEMGAVANTFRGVENLNGASNWEGLYFQKAQQQRSWKRVKPIEV
jgi:hypothetical protein